MAMNIDRIYQQYIKPLPREAQLRLLAKVAAELAAPGEDPPKRSLLELEGLGAEAVQNSRRSIMELHGLGKEIWEGIDAQEYVNKLREEWDHRP